MRCASSSWAARRYASKNTFGTPLSSLTQPCMYNFYYHLSLTWAILYFFALVTCTLILYILHSFFFHHFSHCDVIKAQAKADAYAVGTWLVGAFAAAASRVQHLCTLPHRAHGCAKGIQLHERMSVLESPGVCACLCVCALGVQVCVLACVPAHICIVTLKCSLSLLIIGSDYRPWGHPLWKWLLRVWSISAFGLSQQPSKVSAAHHWRRHRSIQPQLVQLRKGEFFVLFFKICFLSLGTCVAYRCLLFEQISYSKCVWKLSFLSLWCACAQIFFILYFLFLTSSSDQIC